ncbi:hypothetical protein MMC17_008112 [Xylographa soralifera]|nr:hypothetical protein [Xylographa soralifera]
MDGISTAASATALITLALQSSSFIYQFLDAIRDGPEKVQELGRRVDRLHQSLKQIADLIQLAESSDEDDSHNGRCPSEYLRSALSSCANDLQGIQTRISKLKVYDDNSVQRVWSALKYVLGSKYLEHTDRIVSRNLHELNLQLSIIGRRSHMAHETFTSNIKDTAELGLAAATASLSEQKAQRVLLEATMQESQRRFDLLDTATTKIEGLTSASDAQLSKITKMVREIQVQLSSEANACSHDTASTKVLDSIGEGSCQKQNLQASLKSDPLPKEIINRSSGIQPKTEDERSLLDNAINRLCLLAYLEPGKVATEEAECIIDDLETILTMVQRQDQLLVLSEDRGVKRKADATNRSSSDEHPHSPNRALKRLRRILTASQMVDVRQNSPRRQPAARLMGKLLSHNLTRHFKKEDSTVVVSYTSRAPSHPYQMRTERTLNATEDKVASEQTIEKIEGNISVIVPKAPHATKLTVYFEQIVTARHSSMLNPEISFHCIRPLDSAIFHVAARGTLAEFLALLQTPEASLNDCDEFGRSILNYALSKSNVPICRFLTEHNYADANAVEQVVSDYPHRTYRPLFGLYEKLSKRDSEELSCSIDCQRLLLEAGADPTIQSEGSSPFLEIASSGTLVRCPHTLVEEFANIAKAALRLMLDADPYMDLEQRDDQGRTALMLIFLHANRFSMQTREEEVYDMAVTLLDHGSDINACDMSGRGCAEMAYYSTMDKRLGKKEYKHLQGFLVLLIDRGYDIYRTDCRKISVCELTMGFNFVVLWFEALRKSKFNYRISAVLAEDHARHHQRLAANLHDRLEISHDGQSILWGPGSRRTVQETTVTNLPFIRCAGQTCDWLLWRNIKVLSTTTNPEGGSIILCELRTSVWSGRRRYVSRYCVWENDMITGGFSSKCDESDFEDAYHNFRELQNQLDLNNKAETRPEEWNKQKLIYTIVEDASECFFDENAVYWYTRDSIALMVNRRSHSETPGSANSP